MCFSNLVQKYCVVVQPICTMNKNRAICLFSQYSKHCLDYFEYVKRVSHIRSFHEKGHVSVLPYPAMPCVVLPAYLLP